MLALLLAAVLDPRTASVAAALLVGDPELAPRLITICERESGCRAIGVHRCDAHRSRAAWSDAVANMRRPRPRDLPVARPRGRAVVDLGPVGRDAGLLAAAPRMLAGLGLGRPDPQGDRGRAPHAEPTVRPCLGLLPLGRMVQTAQ